MRRALEISDADVTGYITTSFGEPGYGYFGKHAGYDYGVKEWAVKSPEAGVITATYTGRQNVDGGNIVEMDSGQWSHRFLHLETISVVPGQQVSESFTLAISGNSGNVGYHLHHDVRKKGTAWTDSFDNYVDWEKLITEGDDMVKPTEQEVHDTFMKFLQHDVANQDELNFYMNSDKRVLYEQILYNGLCPKEDEVNKAFNDLQPWEPILDKQLPYYTNYPKNVLYCDLAYGLKKHEDVGDDSEYELVTEPIYVKKEK